MAITEVGSGSQRATGAGAGYNNVDSATKAFPGNVGNGNLLICAGTVYNAGGGPAVTVTDTRSTPYTVRTIAYGTTDTLWIAWGVTTSGGACTVTVDPGGTGNYMSFSIDEFTSQHGTPLDVNDGGSSSATSTAPSDSITTGVADALIIGAFGFTELWTSTIVAGGSSTLIGAETDNNNNNAHGAAFRIISGAAGSYAVDWTLGTSSTWTAVTVSFVPSAGGGIPSGSDVSLVGLSESSSNLIRITIIEETS